MNIVVQLCFSLSDALEGKSFAKVALDSPPVADDFIQMSKQLYRIEFVVHIDKNGHMPWAIVTGVRPEDVD